MIHKFILTIFLILSSASTFASWIEYDKDKENTYYSDPERWVIKNESQQIIEVWVKSVIHTDLTKDGLAVGDHMLFRFSINCLDNSNALLSVISYKGGSILDSFHEKYPSYTPNLPDSRGEFLANVACKMSFNPDEN